MANPNSNAIATVTIQDTDLLTTGSPILVQRSNAQVTFPPLTGVFYSGYNTVTSAALTDLSPNGTGVPFLFIRNASPTTISGALSLELTPSGGAAQIITLNPGGIFLWANPVLGPTGNFFTRVRFAVSNAGTTMIMEYLYAF